MKISLIVPCYNEEESLPIFYKEINKIINQINSKFEIILINDGSTDNTLKIMKELSIDKNIKYISFSRNFGKESAILAGLENSTGDYISTIDVDLQDPPELLIQMFEEIKIGKYDCIATRSTSRKGYSFLRKIFTKTYYKLINKISKTQIIDGARDFRLMSRQMVNSILQLKEYNRYSKGIFSWVGFNTKWIEFENQERIAGTTKWNFLKLFSYSLESIIGFSTIPLLFSSFIGVIFCLISFALIIAIITKTLLYGDPVSGWPSLACIIFFVSGIQLFCLGIMGQYLSKMYLEIKNRPVYIVKETNIK